MFTTIDISAVRDEKLARKYNAMVRFANSRKQEIPVMQGAVNYELNNLEYVQEEHRLFKPSKEKIVITWGGLKTEITEAKEIVIDRKYKIICIVR